MKLHRVRKIKTVAGVIQFLRRLPLKTLAGARADTIFSMINGKVETSSGVAIYIRLPK